MPNYAVQISVGMTSNLAADAATNTWSCEAVSDSAASDFASEVITFYRSLVSFFPATVRQDNHGFKIYDRSDAPPRVPTEEGVWTFTGAPTGGPLPSEVALCLSFQGIPESGVTQARKRGRVYLGPIKQTAIDVTGRPTAGFLDVLEAAATALLAASDASTDYTWAVYSGSALDSFPVANGWIDDEFDTQRRRGRLATSRRVFP